MHHGLRQIPTLLSGLEVFCLFPRANGLLKDAGKQAFLIDDLIPHGVHDEPGDRFGSDLRLHVLPDGLDRPGT